METTSNTRTLKAYVSDLLQNPRWIIEHEVDFTGCSYNGQYNAYLPECTNCQFGRGCRWLDRQRAPSIEDAPLEELIKALGGAVEYLQSTYSQQGSECEETRAWLRDARRFLQHAEL